MLWGGAGSVRSMSTAVAICPSGRAAKSTCRQLCGCGRCVRHAGLAAAQDPPPRLAPAVLTSLAILVERSAVNLGGQGSPRTLQRSNLGCRPARLMISLEEKEANAILTKSLLQGVITNITKIKSSNEKSCCFNKITFFINANIVA